MTPNITRVSRFYLYGLTGGSKLGVSQFVNFTWAGSFDYMVGVGGSEA